MYHQVLHKPLGRLTLLFCREQGPHQLSDSFGKHALLHDRCQKLSIFLDRLQRGHLQAACTCQKVGWRMGDGQLELVFTLL